MENEFENKISENNDKNDKYGEVDIWSVLPSLESLVMSEMSEVERQKSRIEYILAQPKRTIILPNKKVVKQFEEQLNNLEAYLRGEPANKEAADAFVLMLGFNW